MLRQDQSGGGSILTDRKHGLPIGNLTSQLFANVYMNAFDHVVKENFRQRYYIRYTDDAVILADTREELIELLPWLRAWLFMHRRLEFHPHKVEIRKLTQGIDFLGYVTLPWHRVLRTKTKKRMLRRVHETNIASYMGVLTHCCGTRLAEEIRRRVE